MASVASLNTVQDLFIAYYQRPGDPSGLLFWATRLDTGTDLSTLQAAFGESPESLALYGPINSSTIGTVIDEIYDSLFNRAPDAAGKQFYIDGFNAGVFTPASIAYNILVGATGSDAVAVVNKQTVADRFSETVDGRPFTDPNFGQGSSFNATYAGDADAVAARTWLDAVTSDPVTIQSESQTVLFIQTTIANPGDPILSVSSGQTFSLTPSVDNILGTAGDDLVLGVFGAGGGTDTYTVADNINGGGGKDTLSLTSQGTTASPTTVTVTNVEVVSIRDLVGSTFDATLVANNPAINFTDTIAGLTSTAKSGSIASSYGLAGKGNLTVDFASTSGTADTANVTLAGVGTSSTTRSTIDVSDGGTIEAVALTASGTNFVTLNAGGAAKTVTVTGAGTNNLAIGSLAVLSTIDASAATGTNTFTLGGTLNTGDVVKGGTGADTLSANFTAASLLNPTISGVETLSLDFDANAIFNLSKTTGATTIGISGSKGSAEIVNAPASITKLNVTTQDTAFTDNDLTFTHAGTTTAALTMTIGSTATSATNITLDEVTLGGTTSLTLNAVGTKDYKITGALLLDEDQSAVTIDVADDAELRITPLNAQGNDIDALTINVGEDATFSGTFQMSGGDLGDVAFTVKAGGSGDIFLTTASGGGSVGDITLSALGRGANLDIMVQVSGGDVGDVTMTVDGTNASGDFEASVSGGSIGDIDISVTGTNAMANFSVSADAFSYDEDYEGTGNIGNVTISVDGSNTLASGNMTTSGGNIGNISITMAGTDTSGNMSFYANWMSGDTDGDTSADDYVQGGDIGDITVDVDGTNAVVYLTFTASGGDIGNVDYSFTGASGVLWLNANEQGDKNDHGGNIGTVDITVGDGSDFSGNIAGEVSVGDITVTAGEGVSGQLGISGGDVGNVTLTMGEDSSFGVQTRFLDGSTGVYTASVGPDGYLDLDFGWIDGAVGPITVTADEGAEVNVNSDGGTIAAMDLVVLIGGEGGEATVDLDTAITLFGGIDASQWLGDLTVDLSGVLAGTTVTVGDGGSTVLMTGFADNVFAGAAPDVIDAGVGDDLVTGGGGGDTITGGVGKDTLQGDAGNDTFVVAAIADFASGEVVGGGAGTDTLQFGAAGAITYVGRTVVSVETLDLTPGATNAVVVTQGTGLVTVKDLGTIAATLTLNQGATAFDVAAQGSAAAVNVAGEWFYNGTGAADGVLTYFDQTGNAAVTVTLTGVETGALTGGVASVGGNLVFTQA